MATRNTIDDLKHVTRALKDQHASIQLRSPEMKATICDAGLCEICALINRIAQKYPEPAFDLNNIVGDL